MSQINKITNVIKNKQTFSYSFEVTPDVSKEELQELEGDPQFFSVTWHAKSHQCKDLNIGPLRIASLLVNMNKTVLMHLSCDMLTEEYLTRLLFKLQELKICNLFLILGEGSPIPPNFRNTNELIKFIRKTTGEYFCIGIAGFPECSEERILDLKEKIDSGADFIITQAFFDFDVYKTFQDRCINKNIQVPIIPGVFSFENYAQFNGFLNMCKVKVSNNLREKVQAMEISGESCNEIIKQLIRELITKFHVNHFHFFTLNKLQNTYKIIDQILI